LRSFIVTLLALAVAPLFGATPSISVELSDRKITVGDPIEITVTAIADEGVTLGEVTMGDLLNDIVQPEEFEPVSVDRESEDLTEGGQIVRWKTRLVPFITGNFHLPSVSVVWSTMDGASGELSTPLGEIDIESILRAGAVPLEPEPPRGPFDLLEPRPVWPWLVGGGVLLAALLGYWAWRRFEVREQPTVVRPKRRRPPHEVALEDLEALANSDVLRLGELRIFFYTLSGVVRVYFEEEFAIGAPEMTSSELLAALRGREFPLELLDQMQRWIHACDLVKYASQIPREEHCQRAVTLAKAIVSDAHQHFLALKEEAAQRAA
jgi:hypothetical protein